MNAPRSRLACLLIAASAAGIGAAFAADRGDAGNTAPPFVRVSPRDARYLELSDGRPYIPIGLNLIAPSTKPEAGEAGLAAFEQWCRRLAENRGNFIRVWISHAFWDVEPRQSGVYDEAQAGRIRAMLAMARRHGLRVKLCVEHFRSLDPNYRQTWSQKLIHRTDRGGPAADVEDFFRGERSREQFRRKLAWLAAQIGEDPTIFAWELWNEVNAVQAKPTAFMPWTQEMLAELHRLFPRLLAVQSLGSFDRDSSRSVYREHSLMPGNDLAQVHRYLDLGAQLKVCHGPVDVLAADAVRELLAWNPGRPVLLAESGAVEPGHAGPFKLYAQDTEGIILHDVLFAPFFAGAAGPGHCWHWGQYVDANNLWHHFSRFAAAIEGVDPAGGMLQPRSWETPRLRVYALVGQSELLLWCRDVRNPWSSELADRRPPETITGGEIDLAAVLGNSAAGRVRCYNPWTDKWSEAPRRGTTVTLPTFERSCVLRIAVR